MELYRPSNSSEGDWFMSKFCDKCAKFPVSTDAACQCQIFIKTLALHTSDKGYPKQWQYDDKGCPVCTSFKDRKQFNESRKNRIRNKDRKTMELFG